MAGKLILVGTPIGNLNDMSPRTAEAFREADFIAAEDTRVTVKLLNHLGIKKPLVSYYEHNRAESGEKILSRLLAGEVCALATDAGMPAISDPGEDIVDMCHEAGIEVIAVPGPCAAVCGLALSGLPTGRFTFEGFLSTVKKNRYAHLEELKSEKRTMIFYEAPHKLKATLADMASYFGSDRRLSISRELTKLHEETRRTTLGEAVKYYDIVPPKGEFVLIIEGAAESGEPEITMEQAVEMVNRLIDGGMSRKDAVKQTAKDTGIPKNRLYDEVIG